MARKTARITIYDSRIEQSFRTGSIYQNMRRVATDNEDYAIALAPKRTGRMAKNIRKSITPSGKLHWRYTVNTNTDYAIFTLVGTTGPITSNKPGGLLWIRPKPYSYFSYRPEFAHKAGRTPMFWVHGQKGDDWLKKATYLTFKKNRLI